jgi:hypothetical protein
MEVAAMRSASVLSFSFYFNGKENSMTKFAILGAAVVFFALAGPAIAQHSVANPSYIVETGVCPGHEPEIPIYRAGGLRRLEHQPCLLCLK